MKINNPADIIDLPEAPLVLIKNGVVYYTNASDPRDYLMQAAQCILDHKDQSNFKTQAEVIERAINVYAWGLGSSGYKAALHPPQPG